MTTVTGVRKVTSYRAARFAFEDVSSEFIHKVAFLLEQHESVVLLGPRGIGKQIVIADVHYQLTSQRSGIEFVRLRCENHFNTAEETLSIDAAEQLPHRPGAVRTISDLARSIRNHLANVPAHIVFLVSNVDLLPDSLSRRLLKMFLELTSLGSSARGQVTVLMTGAVDLGPLVFGADSEFIPRHQYVIQGLALEKFAERTAQLTRAVGLDVDQDCTTRLHHECRGSLLLLQLVADSILDRRRMSGTPRSDSISTDELQRVIDAIKQHSSIFADVVFRSFVRLEAADQALSSLESLLSGNSCEIPNGFQSTDGISTSGTPTELELCGLACRNRGRLKWHSPLIEALARRYFTDYVLGDAFACCNDWEKAFECYRRAESAGEPWVHSSSRRPRLQAALRAFETKLHSIAGRSVQPVDVDEVLDFFSKGARFLLGFDDVSFWRFNDRADEWRRLSPVPDSEDDSPIESETARWACPERAAITAREPHHRLLLRGPEDGAEGPLEVEPADAPFASAVRLPKIDGIAPECVVMSCFRLKNPLTKDRRSQVESVTDAFSDAYRQAHRNQQLSSAAHYQNHLLAALPDVFQVMGGSPERTKQALKAAGEALRSHEYRRVMFSMVDPTRDRIVGVIDCRERDECDIAAMTDWPLNVAFDSEGKPIDNDVQQACVRQGQTIVVDDAESHPITNKQVVETADLKAMVIIPLRLQQREEVLGTMHVERQDRRPLEPDQRRALEYFAQQVARAIDVTTRVDLIEDATHEQADAIVFVDHNERIRYLNHRGHELTQLPEGWQNEQQLIPAEEKLPKDVISVMRQSRERDRGDWTNSPPSRLGGANGSVSGYVRFEGADQPIHVVYARPVKDWRGCAVGTMLQIRDLEHLNCLLDSLKRFAACRTTENLAREVVRSIELLGHKWARLYLIDRVTERLVGRAQVGFDPDSDGAKAFRDGMAVLPGRDQSANSWLCLEEGQPVVLTTSSKRPPGDRFLTANGLTAMNVRDECHPPYLTKEDGQYWADIPMYSREEHDEWLGKVSVHCPETLTLEDFEILRILAEAAGTTFAAIAEHEQRAREVDSKRREAMQFAIAETCHRLNSLLASLETLEERYRDAQTPDELNGLNERWVERKREIQSVLDNAKLRLRPLQCRRTRRNLAGLLKDIGELQLGARFRVTIEGRGGAKDYLADVDDRLITEAIEELIMNSRKAIGRGVSPNMMVDVSSSPITRDGVSMCRIKIRDNGPGVPKERRDRIFDDFFSEWQKPDARGTGLGLSFVQNVVRAHDGTIRCIDAASGACFLIEFPRYDSKAESVPECVAAGGGATLNGGRQ